MDPDNSTTRLKPDLNNQAYKQLLKTVHRETPGLHLLSLVDIESGQIYALPDETAVEQAALACCLFGGQATEKLREFDKAGAWSLSSYRVGGHQLMVLSDSGCEGEVVIIAFPDHAQVSRLQQLQAEVGQALQGKSLTEALPGCRSVMRAWRINIDRRELVESYQRLGVEKSKSMMGIDVLDPIDDILPLVQSLELRELGADRPWLDAAMVVFEGHVLRWVRVPFVSGHVLFADSPTSADDQRVREAMESAQNDILRQVIAETLAAGLQTRTEPFPETDIEFAAIVRDLRDLQSDDLRGRLIEGGFADHPLEMAGINMRCRECIYFLPNRRWCDLPELPIPVEPDWYCRLWKL